MTLRTLAALYGLCCTFMAFAQVPVTAAPDQAALLASANPKLAEYKRLVYDFWREVFEGAHIEFADKYMAEGYIQHNPNVPTGRAAFIEAFSARVKPHEIADRVRAPLVAILADGDLVVLAFAREGVDPKDPAKKFSTTWFDMFRIDGGRIAEHWDPAQKQ
jgi:predicted SnoaL-like aldol condensation-catalyzing enzyme